MSSLSSAPAQAKTAAKRLLTQNPALKNNRLYYELEKTRAYRQIALRPELTARKDLLGELNQHGFVVVPDFLSRAEVEPMLAAAEDVIEDAKSGRLQQNFFATRPDVFFRISAADKVIPETAPYFQNPTLHSLAQAYMSPNVVSYRRELDCRFGVSESVQADLYHFDNWRPICKAFLYLVDVTEDNAPFVYVPGSHRQERWRVRHNMAYDLGKNGRFGYFFPQEIRDLRARFGWEDAVCTGKAGTLILADLRGLHRGTPLRSGRRVMLTNVWDLMNQAGE
jgi:hypothetical protein